MASTTCVVSMAMPLAYSSTHKKLITSTSFNPLPMRPSTLPKPGAARFVVQSSFKEQAVTAATAAALTASMVVPDVAVAASGVSPSLNNFLLSIAAGGVVLTAILGAIIGVSNFDPVKRA
ncbi:uncharacterized protein LOC112517014 [Cynara cardunculus var. scolymus]|uniref:Photosystem II PsbX n=1 Tax=Cynara cardunculus var. scolymus TaxID=59895 RepID=A0A103XNP6_CYNCS|nr:uncharacterized protein LOC112517014 [Cynara cardunculus var. scolymus]KVH94035.1 Photosystem II PsbX [Cynara cardunculus var. scolymus]